MLTSLEIITELIKYIEKNAIRHNFVMSLLETKHFVFVTNIFIDYRNKFKTQIIVRALYLFLSASCFVVIFIILLVFFVSYLIC